MKQRRKTQQLGRDKDDGRKKYYYTRSHKAQSSERRKVNPKIDSQELSSPLSAPHPWALSNSYEQQLKELQSC
jgi:hypothetical protein